MTTGHLGEWLAARIFRIEREPTAVTGHFRLPPLGIRRHRAVLGSSPLSTPDALPCTACLCYERSVRLLLVARA
jgi:hypothetical protein